MYTKGVNFMGGSELEILRWAFNNLLSVLLDDGWYLHNGIHRCTADLVQLNVE